MVPLQLARVEALESRSLLAVAAPGLKASIAVRPEVTTAGTALVMTFTERNTSKHAIGIGVGPTGDGFVVEQGSTVVWRSNAGVQPDFVMLVTLKPGQSYTTKATWDGRSNQGDPANQGGPGGEEFGPYLSGKFTVSNELAEQVRAKFKLPSRTTHGNHP